LNNNPVSTIDPTGMDDWGIIDEEEAAVSTYAQEEQYAADYAMQYESEAAGEESNAMGALASMSDYLNEENDKLAAETGVSLTEEDERDPWPKNVPKDATFLGQNEYHESVYVSADGGTRYFVNDNGENYSKKMNLPDMNYFDHLPGGKYFWNTYMGQDIIKAFPFLADPNTRQALGSKLSDTFFEGLVDDIWGKIFPWPIPIEVPDDFPMPVDNPLIRTPK